VSRSFSTGAGEVHALNEASLAVHAGELLVLRGPSGSGKTTLLNILGGLDKPTSGEVWLRDRELTKMTEKELIEVRRQDLGYVFQSFGLIPILSAAENVEVPLRILELPTAEREARVAEVLDLVGLSDHAQQRPYELSGGQQQRVGLARALASRPSILLADEPTGQLDSGTAAAMMDLLTRLVHSTNIAAVVSTHDPLLMSRADTVLEIHDGHLREPASHGRHAAPVAPV
jgi:putative ABC transport system ATP-binding protein